MHFWVYYTAMFLHPVIFLFVLARAKRTYMGVSDYGISEFHWVLWFLHKEVDTFSNAFFLLGANTHTYLYFKDRNITKFYPFVWLLRKWFGTPIDPSLLFSWPSVCFSDRWTTEFHAFCNSYTKRLLHSVMYFCGYYAFIHAL